MTDTERDERAGDSGTPVNELALASLFLSVVWIFGLGSLAGIVLGRRAMRAIDRSQGAEGGAIFAKAAIVIGIFGLGSTGLVIAIAIQASGA